MRTAWLAAVICWLCVPLGAADDDAEARASSRANLKEIGAAFHAHHDKNEALADNIRAKDGKPLLSWRVAILPHLGEEKLYKQFKLDEAWDSEHNKTLIAKMPNVYAPAKLKLKVGETYYQTFTGKGALFGSGGKLTIPASMPDGTSQTALVVEAGGPVVWTRPADLPFDEKKPLPPLGGLFDGEFHGVMVDGSVVRFKRQFDATEMKKVVTPADGLVIDFEKVIHSGS